jgi:hypothetical protein
MASVTVVPFLFVSYKGLLNVFKIFIFEFEPVIPKFIKRTNILKSSDKCSYEASWPCELANINPEWSLTLVDLVC